MYEKVINKIVSFLSNAFMVVAFIGMPYALTICYFGLLVGDRISVENAFVLFAINLYIYLFSIKGRGV